MQQLLLVEGISAVICATKPDYDICFFTNPDDTTAKLPGCFAHVRDPPC